MSSSHTHMLIGAVGGLAAFKIVSHLAPTVLSFRISLADTTLIVPTIVVGIGIIGISAYLALWPDIDEPGTFISHQAGHFMWLLGAMIGLIVTVVMTQSITLIVIGVLLGTVIGLLCGQPILWALRFVPGGHRRLTHSLVVGAGLFVLGGVTTLMGVRPVALPAFALAWGQMLHLAGDVETRGGVPLLYPLTPYDFHLFPYEISRFGELVAASLAIISGFLLLLWR